VTTPAWADAMSAARVFAVDPHGIGGIRLRGPAGGIRSAWLEEVGRLTGAGPRLRAVPSQVSESRLLGGLDLAETLRCGRPVAESGLLALAHGGVLVLQTAERLPVGTAAHLCAALDEGRVQLERDGFSAKFDARVACIACDEGMDSEEAPPAPLLDRIGMWIDLQGAHWSDCGTMESAGESASEGYGEWEEETADSSAEESATESADDPAAHPAVMRARGRLAQVEAPPEVLRALCGACAALGIDSLRVPLLALRVARAAAALAGAASVRPEDAALAARYVIAPRARSVPADEAAPQEPPAPESAPPDSSGEPDTAPAPEGGALSDVVLEAARAALPPDLLDALSRGMLRRSAAGSGGRTGLQSASVRRGRPVGSRRGELQGGARLHVLDTLRAAAPWQSVRQGPVPAGRTRHARIDVRREDLRVIRFRRRSQTTVVFAVDASGSAAMSRLAEAKGAIEIFLAECYVRRDQVALVAFRGSDAELLLSPTRSLARARRCLAAVPGGGGTPVAAGLRAAAQVAGAARRRGEVPLIVVLTDGKANIALDGSPGRGKAGEDAIAMSRLVRREGFRVLMVDFSPRGQAEARELARELAAHYLHLPQAQASFVASAVKELRMGSS